MRGRSTIVGGGIQSGVPFTLNAVLFVQNTNPATAGTTDFLSVVPTGANRAVIVGTAGDPQPAAVERLRITGGLISESTGVGNSDTFIAGRGVNPLPNNSSKAIAIVPSGANFNAQAVGGSVIIGDTFVSTAAAGLSGSVYIGRNLTTGQPGVQIAPDSTIGSGAGGKNTVIGSTNTLTTSQAASDSCIFGHNNTVDGGLGSGQHLVVGPSNTIHATATAGGNGLLVGNGNFLSDGASNSILVGFSNGFSVSGSGVRNILIGRNLQANGAAGPFSSNVLIGFGTKLDSLPQTTGVIAFCDGQGVGYSMIVFGNGGNNGVANDLTNAAPNPLTFRLTNGQGNNVVAGNLTVQPGLSTGNAAGAQIIFQTGVVQASGGTLQAATQRVLISGTSTNATLSVNAPDSNTAIPVVVITGQANNKGINFAGFTNGAAAAAGTLTNAPVAGNPSFWLPVQIAGVARFIPCW